MVSVHFADYKDYGEQDLVSDLQAEAISIMGNEVMYVPQVMVNQDPVTHENPSARYERYFPVDVWVKSHENFEGEGTNISSVLGFQVRDRTVFTLSRQTFARDVTRLAPEYVRPREGDIIFWPVDERAYQIKYVENYSVMYQMGALQSWDLSCELFEYSSEELDTGIAALDALQTTRSENLLDWSVLTSDGTPIVTSDGSYLAVGAYSARDVYELDDSDDLQERGEDILDYSERDPYSGEDSY